MNVICISLKFTVRKVYILLHTDLLNVLLLLLVAGWRDSDVPHNYFPITSSYCIQMPKILSAHEDFIRAMALTGIDLVVSGSGSNDGYAAVWKTIEI